MNRATLRVRWRLVVFLGFVGAGFINGFVAGDVCGEWVAATVQSSVLSGNESELWDAFIVAGAVASAPLVYWCVGLWIGGLVAYRAQRAGQNGGAQRADKARQLDRDAVLGPAGSQAGGFPALGGGGRGVGDAAKSCGRRMDKAGGSAPAEPVDGHALPAPKAESL